MKTKAYEGRVIAVVGGANGIGRATATLLAEAGACVAIGDYRADPALVEFLDTLAKTNGGKFLGVSD